MPITNKLYVIINSTTLLKMPQFQGKGFQIIIKFGTHRDDDEKWLSKFINHFHFQVMPLNSKYNACIILQ